MKQKIITEIKKMNCWLVEGDYKALENYSDNNQFDAEDMAEAISSYPYKLIDYPNDAAIEPYIMEYDEPNTWAVSCPLWTQEERKSDLYIDFDIELNKNDNAIVTLNTIEVP